MYDKNKFCWKGVVVSIETDLAYGGKQWSMSVCRHIDNLEETF